MGLLLLSINQPSNRTLSDTQKEILIKNGIPSPRHERIFVKDHDKHKYLPVSFFKYKIMDFSVPRLIVYAKSFHPQILSW